MKVLHKIRFAAKANHFKGYAIHSPFIFGVVSSLIYAKYPFYGFSRLSKAYGQLSKTEKKTALSLKDGFRLFRLLNSIASNNVITYDPDRFDSVILNYFNMPGSKRMGDPEDSIRTVLFISEITENEWNTLQKKYGNDNSAVFIVKHPNRHQKKLWRELLNTSSITSSITFYGMGIAFTNVHLPKKNFRIVK